MLYYADLLQFYSVLRKLRIDCAYNSDLSTSSYLAIHLSCPASGFSVLPSNQPWMIRGVRGIHARSIHKWRRIASCWGGAAKKSYISYMLFAAKFSGLPWYCVTIASCSLPSMSTLSVPLMVGKIRRSIEREIRDRFEKFPPSLFLSSRRQSDPVTGWYHFNISF